MRLIKIKLAGFKSFVDPTTVEFKTNMMAIVGPNGCGKSNVIDAVRWVMGESSAKYLRGESSVDVIFNGSTARKPVGQASIELVFDNTVDRLEGQFAQYNEISVKRVVTRDAVSTYYLNGAKCRKRDITDLFLGTGLGPRSYAIIQQGTVSRLIEAKPEELRVFIEEAAGISKYKERRKETETRIRHTRENLERLSDLREEIDKQLEKLQRQAKAAERYKTLKEQERNAQALLLAVRLRDIASNAEGKQQEIQKYETLFEEHMAGQREAEHKLEASRASLAESNEFLNKAQANFYQIGSEVARLEQTIHHRAEEQERLDADSVEINAQLEETRHTLATDAERLAIIDEKLIDLEPEFELLTEADESASEQLATLEEKSDALEQEWEALSAEANKPIQQAQSDRATITELEKQVVRLSDQISRLKNEQQNLRVDEIEETVELAAAQLLEKEEATELLVEKISEIKANLSEHLNQKTDLTKQVHELQQVLSELRGKLSSLDALQAAATAEPTNTLADWLSEADIQVKGTVIDHIKVEAGYESAVESALGLKTHALILEQFDKLLTSFPPADCGELVFIDGSTGSNEQSSTTQLTPITAFVSTEINGLLSLFDGIYFAESDSDAIQAQASLSGQELVVSRAGVTYGRNFIYRSNPDGAEQGVIARKQEIERLQTQIELQQEKINNIQVQQKELEATITQGESTLAEHQQRHAEFMREQSQANAHHSTLKSRYEHLQQRKDQIGDELQQLIVQHESDQQEIEEKQSGLHNALELAEKLSERKVALQTEREAMRVNLAEVRQQRLQSRDKLHTITVELEGIRREKQSVETGKLRLESQLQQLQQRKAALDERLAHKDDPAEDVQIQLEEKLAHRLVAEETLVKARNEVQGIENAIRDNEEKRLKAEKLAYETRTTLEQLRLGAQDAQTRMSTINDQLQENGVEQQALLDDLPEGITETSLVEELEQLDGKIQRLGAINLAAIDEYEEQSKRSEYIHAQNDDLNKALDILESAIRKIDRETRQRFKETFDRVDAGYRRIFPRVFGGGEAYLELTGDDLLDTGVSVMARPPGKKNSTIHLLSGGEKALTALSLVFSIFELNPAPFCLLDEVDAPLDEANVGRFCNMVREMSDNVQFMYITHNKQAMETASHLVGVTMHEPGVSRIVSVDLDEAAQLAAM